ncbi:MAG: DUF1232 domain-containing protein [Chloroflexi bacterium]|nr:DUF1232 domain-containing protein [Chloroflexota bacterium]
MNVRLPRWMQYRVLRTAWEDARVVWRLLQDTRIPLWMKVLFPAAGAAYLFFPLDFLPDIVPILGEVDDVMLLLLLMRLFISLSPEEVVQEVRAHLRGEIPPKAKVIDGTYRVVE